MIGNFDFFKFFITAFYYFIQTNCSEKVTFQRKLTAVGFFTPL